MKVLKTKSLRINNMVKEKPKWMPMFIHIFLNADTTVEYPEDDIELLKNFPKLKTEQEMSPEDIYENVKDKKDKGMNRTVVSEKEALEKAKKAAKGKEVKVKSLEDNS